MKIGQNSVVELCYELEVDGEIVDRTTRERPLDYIHGTGSLLKKFEQNIEGLEPGGKFSFTLTPAEGYGEVDPDRIIDLPKEAFEVNGQIMEDLLVPGATIPLVNGMGGIVPGKVLQLSYGRKDPEFYRRNRFRTRGDGKGTERRPARRICPSMQLRRRLSR